jgi:hypothetical protein
MRVSPCRNNMEKIVEKYRKWKEEHPEEDYQTDEIFEFANSLGRGDLVSVFEYLDDLIEYKARQRAIFNTGYIGRAKEIKK